MVYSSDICICLLPVLTFLEVVWLWFQVPDTPPHLHWLYTVVLSDLLSEEDQIRPTACIHLSL